MNTVTIDLAHYEQIMSRSKELDALISSGAVTVFHWGNPNMRTTLVLGENEAIKQLCEKNADLAENINILKGELFKAKSQRKKFWQL